MSEETRDKPTESTDASEAQDVTEPDDESSNGTAESIGFLGIALITTCVLLVIILATKAWDGYHCENRALRAVDVTGSWFTVDTGLFLFPQGQSADERWNYELDPETNQLTMWFGTEEPTADVPVLVFERTE